VAQVVCRDVSLPLPLPQINQITQHFCADFRQILRPFKEQCGYFWRMYLVKLEEKLKVLLSKGIFGILVLLKLMKKIIASEN